jgi:hypothetical protein
VFEAVSSFVTVSNFPGCVSSGFASFVRAWFAPVTLQVASKPLIFYGIFGVSFGVSSCSVFCAFHMQDTAKMVLKTAGPREKLVSVLVSVWIVLLSNFLQLDAK